MMTGPDIDVHVRLRDLASGDRGVYSEVGWPDLQGKLVAGALAVHAGMARGTLVLAGTAERGRIPLTDAACGMAADVDWQTMTSDEVAALRSQPDGQRTGP